MGNTEDDDGAELPLFRPQVLELFHYDPRVAPFFSDSSPGSTPPKDDENKSAPAPSGNPGEAEKELGNQAFRAGKLEETLGHYDRAIELDPTNVLFYSNKVTVLNKLGRQEASVVAQLGIEKSRQSGASYEAIARAFQKIAASYTQLGNLDGVIEALKSSLLEKNDRAGKKELKGLQERRTKQKAKEYENPELAEKAKNDGNNAFKNTDYLPAIEFYTEAIT